MLAVVLIPALLWLVARGDRRDHNVVDRLVTAVVAPGQGVVVAAGGALVGLWRGYIDLVGVRADNLQLAGDNARLAAELVQREEYRLENERLRQLLGLRAHAPEVEMVLAEIVATSPTPLYRSVRINRGRRHGINLGAAVVAAAGVVGRVAALGQTSAEVMLLVDASHSMDVVVQRSRARARLRGTGVDGELAAETQYLARTADVVPGDLVVTSGLGGTFPKGLPVGTVTACARPAFGLFQQVQVRPSVDFARLEVLMVIRGRASGEADLQAAAAPSGL